MTAGPDPLAATTTLASHLGRILSRSAEPVCPAIHPADEMLTYPMQVLGRSATEAVIEYFQVGNATFSLLTQVLEWLDTSWPRVGSVLDFASGYGRVARFVAAAGCPRVTVADILAPAVAFQQQVLGVQGFVSTTSPDRTQLGGPYDFISVISLFSHLPEATFAGWLRRLTGALAPGGTLLFTTHGPAALAREGGQPLPARGFSFHRASESSQLDTSEYGTSFVHPDYVQRLLGKLRGTSLLAMVPLGLNDHQDVYVVGRGRTRPPAPLQLAPPPRICIDAAQRHPDGSVHANGWALDGTGHQPVRSVTGYLGDHCLGGATLGLARPDLVPVFHSDRAADGGWRLDNPTATPPATWFTALAEDDRGRRGFAYRPL
jgi:SAM-dependent methyltransferase